MYSRRSRRRHLIPFVTVRFDLAGDDACRCGGRPTGVLEIAAAVYAFYRLGQQCCFARPSRGPMTSTRDNAPRECAPWIKSVRILATLAIVGFFLGKFLSGNR